MSTNRPQAILNVSAGADSIVMIKYPSIACTFFGRMLGMLCESIPVKIYGIKLSYLLFGLLVSPSAALIYFYLKVAGHRYVLTAFGVQKRAAVGNRLVSEVSLSAVNQIAVDQTAGQKFYKASDLVLLNSDGDAILRLEAVPQAEIFRQNLLETRDARTEVQAALETILARESA